MKKHNHQAIILGDSFNNTLGLIRSLGEAKIDIVLLLVGEDRLHISRSRYLHTDKVYKIADIEDCLSIIDKLYDSSKRQYIICSNDKAAQFVDANEEVLSQHFITPLRGKRLENMMDKDAQCKLATECGIKVPVSIIYDREEEFPNNCSYPILLKPTNSNTGLKSDIHICNTYKEVQQCLDKETNCRRYIVQEYIPKELLRTRYL